MFIGTSVVWQVFGLIVNGIAWNLIKPAVRVTFRVEANLALSGSYFKSHYNLYSVKGYLYSAIYHAANRYV
jgi:hypothetical protein